MDVEEAIAICSKEFPKGLEVVAKALNAEIIYGDLGKCEGWCVRHLSGASTIRINNSQPLNRQRSTLAHELGHLLDGSRTQVYGSPYSFNSLNERNAFKIGGDLLLPPTILLNIITEFPLSPMSLKYLADKAKVSQTVAAIQFAKIATNFGCEAVAVVGFNKDKKPTWFPLKTFKGVKKVAERVFEEASQSKRHVSRFDNYIGFTIESGYIPMVLIQEVLDSSKTLTEIADGFADKEILHSEHRNSFQACVGMFGKKIQFRCPDCTAQEAAYSFLKHYEGKWGVEFETKLASKEGLEYLKIPDSNGI